MNRNSSISSSEIAWRRFCGLALLGALAPIAVLYALMLIIDPYDSVPFSPAWDRYPVRSDHRHWNAKLVRQPGFDSLVIGTSTAMLMKPQVLEAAFGGRFVNLAMPSATPFESLRLLERFRSSRLAVRTVLVGIDSQWCQPDISRPFTNEKLRKASPEWLYDSVLWNDLPPFNKTSLKATYDQARAMLGLFVPYQRWRDGYEDITKSLHKHTDPESVRKRIYDGPHEGRLWRKQNYHDHPAYPGLAQLADALESLPATTLKILFFAPYHVFHQAEPGSEQEALWEGCKQRAAALAHRLPNSVVVDFLRRSRITRDDSNFIDGYHYTTAIADELMHYLDLAVHGDPPEREEYAVIARSPVALAPSASR
ncbi:hypothetical protein EWI61_08420 [Methylolobus aquaticus]|nr:hypothetical protein EWI61_08420 [Methylolobus aquaticus]